ncbi:hypothetical protein [Methylobacterium sp. yr668]|uniref:hypothetical protein n=1 Tax=Methylobacterium sp. yr668 TaxID=1761801 RepID=UPI0008F3292F|nr:hypothetical protein [Methylobacterium sp. yr668]SFT30428.1 hypothetical protein SAMN04487845_1756 [Methylobacterium sp. yr668]
MPQASQPATTPKPPAPAPEGLRLRFDRGERRAAVSVDATRGLATWVDGTRTFEFVLATEPPLPDLPLGSTTLQLKLAQKAEPTVNGDEVACHVAGDPGDGKSTVALSVAGVLRRSDVVSIDKSATRQLVAIGTPTDAA